MGIKDLFLQKGWAGKTLTRAETVERLNPILRQHIRLNHGYRHVIERVSEPPVAERFSTLLRTARMDVGKLSETILSCGGAPYTGTDIDTADVNLGREDDAMLFALLDREQALRDRVTEEGDVDHQMRTRAILGKVREHSSERLDALKDVTKRRHRPTPQEGTPAVQTPVEPAEAAPPASAPEETAPKEKTPGKDRMAREDKPWRKKPSE